MSRYIDADVLKEECYKFKNNVSRIAMAFVQGQINAAPTANVAPKADVARETAEQIKRYLRLNEDIAKKCKEENGEKNEEYWKGKLAAFLQIRGYIDTELKKKYESEGADDEP